MIKLAANLSILFTEMPLAERFQKAADAGFRVVEVSYPLDEESTKAKEDAGLELLQFNLEMGDLESGDRGLLSLPNHKECFRSDFEEAIQHADRLQVRQLNCLPGNRDAAFSIEEQLACIRENLEWLHPQLDASDLLLNVEPLSIYHGPHLLFARPSDVFSILKQLDLPRIGVQYDLFHMQLMEGNLTTTLRDNLSLIGHIQIADVPDRHQPGTGEINYRYVLGELEVMGYEKFVSLEYTPLGSTEESLAWLPVECRVHAQAGDLRL
jgi:hydroxypyruvate isomerase